MLNKYACQLGLQFEWRSFDWFDIYPYFLNIKRPPPAPLERMQGIFAQHFLT